MTIRKQPSFAVVRKRKRSRPNLPGQGNVREDGAHVFRPAREKRGPLTDAPWEPFPPSDPPAWARQL
jgi:hypothetical protein